MKNLYYDGKLSKDINECFQNNVVLSEKMYKDYVELYKTDYSMRVQYANNLVALGKFDKAETVLRMAENNYATDANYMNSKKDMDLFINLLVVTKLKLYIHTERYEEAYEMLNQYPEALRKFLGDYLAIELYLEKKLQLDYPEHIPNYYLYQQIVDYDYNKFIENVKLLHGMETHNDGVSYFDSNFPYEEICEELKIIIPNNKRINNGPIENHYYFKYDKCGYDMGISTDYFSLVTYDNSNEFITMYPVQEKEKYPCIDLNYMKREELPPHKRVRRVSQIEKFKKRYESMI